MRSLYYLGVGERGEEREERRLLDGVLLVLGWTVSHLQQILSHSRQHLSSGNVLHPKEYWKEGETLFGSEKIWNFYVGEEPVLCLLPCQHRQRLLCLHAHFLAI